MASELNKKQIKGKKTMERQNIRTKSSKKRNQPTESMRILLYFAMLTEVLKAVFPPAGKCWLKDFGGQTTPTTTTFQVDCLSSQNSFQFSTWVKLSSNVPENEIRVLFMYHQKIHLGFRGLAGGNHEVVVLKYDESNTTPIMTSPIGAIGKWRFIWLQVTNTKASLAVRSTRTYYFENHKYYEYTYPGSNPFVYGSTTATNKAYIGVNDATNGFTAVSSETRRSMFECKKIPTTLIVNYHIFPYLYRASLKAAYLFDFDAQEFVNAVSLAKQPFVTRGASDAVQSSDPAFTSDKVYKISNGQYLQVGEIDYIWATPENLYVVTHVLKVKFLALPTAPAKEPFYTFISDKTLEIKLTSDKRFDVGTGSLRFITPSYNFNVNQWYFFRIVYSRQYYDELLFHCSIEIEILGIGSNGGYIQCVYLPTNNGGAFRWLSSKLGGSNVAGGTMEFEVESLFAYKGAARLIDTQVETNCAGVAAGSDPCRIYSTHSMRKTCLHCHSPDGSIKWVFRSDSQQADCDASFLGPTLAPASRARFTNTYDSCQKGQRVSSGACVACPSACISCSGTNCVGCSWVNRKLPVGSACGGVCPGTKYYYFGDCYPCASACDGGGGCLKGICTFPTGISVNIYGSNCDLTDKHFTAPGAGCGGCAGNCDICFGTQNDNCYTCPSGRALNIDDNTCLGSCDPTNSKYVDASGLCKTCPTNCQSCLGSSFCTDCKAGFYLNGKSCTTCDTANGYYLNTGNTPKTCDACSPGCKQCSSATSCTTCDTGAGWTPVGAYCCPSNCGACTNGVCTSCNTGAGYYVSGGTCSSCAITNGKFIPPSGDACSNCETGCKECTDQNTCTKCDATGNLYLSSGDCLACDLTNGKFIPPTRNACSNCESNCKECTDQNTCTKCDTANGYYLDSSNCLSCSINIGKYIDLAANPQTCNNCISNCKQCPDGTTCTTCQPNYIKSADSQTCSFCNPVGNYIHTGTTPNQCKPCIQGCLTCSDSTTCSVCDTANNYSLGSGNQCLLPQTSQPTQQNQPNQPNQPSQPNQPNSSNCHQTCKACEGYGILDCRQLLLKQLYHPSWNL